MNALSAWFRFAPVSKQLARTPFIKANTFTLSSSEFTGEVADDDGCWLVRTAVGAGFLDSDKQTLEKCPSCICSKRGLAQGI